MYGEKHALTSVADIFKRARAEWFRRLTRKAKVRTVVGSNAVLDSLAAVRNSSPGRPEPCE